MNRINRALISGLLASCLLLLAGCRRVAVNTAPDTPVIGGPHRGGLDTVYAFTATASDSDGDSVSLRFDWGDGDTSDWSGWVAGGEAVQMSHAWQSFNTFWVRAQARDPHDSLSAWSPLSAGELLIDPVRWRYVNPPNQVASASLSMALDGTIYVGVAEGDIDALNPDGTRRWRASAGITLPSIGPDGSIYTQDTTIYALNPDGTLRWSHLLETVPRRQLMSHTAVGPDGTVYVEYDTSLFAFRPDGTELWCFPLLGQTGADPAVGPDGTIYIGDPQAYHAVRPDGTEKWHYPMKAKVSTTAFGPDGTVYVTGDSFVALTPDGVRNWAVPASEASSVVVGSDGAIYHCTAGLYSNGELAVRNPDGTLRNTFAVSGGARGTPALAADGTVYVIAGEGTLCAVGPDGTVSWQYDVGGLIRSDIMLGPDGTVYVNVGGSGLDGVYAINIPNGLADAPWPMYLHDPQRTGCAVARR